MAEPTPRTMIRNMTRNATEADDTIQLAPQREPQQAAASARRSSPRRRGTAAANAASSATLPPDATPRTLIHAMTSGGTDDSMASSNMSTLTAAPSTAKKRQAKGSLVAAAAAGAARASRGQAAAAAGSAADTSITQRTPRTLIRNMLAATPADSVSTAAPSFVADVSLAAASNISAEAPSLGQSAIVAPESPVALPEDPDVTLLQHAAAAAAAKTPVKKVHRASQKAASGPLPTARIKALFDGFSNMRTAGSAYPTVAAAVQQHLQQLADTLAEHVGRTKRVTVEERDMLAIFISQQLATNESSLQALIRAHLPMEYVEKLIPYARANNQLYPPLKKAKRGRRKGGAEDDSDEDDDDVAAAAAAGTSSARRRTKKDDDDDDGDDDDDDFDDDDLEEDDDEL